MKRMYGLDSSCYSSFREFMDPLGWRPIGISGITALMRQNQSPAYLRVACLGSDQHLGQPVLD